MRSEYSAETEQRAFTLEPEDSSPTATSAVRHVSCPDSSGVRLHSFSRPKPEISHSVQLGNTRSGSGRHTGRTSSEFIAQTPMSVFSFNRAASGRRRVRPRQEVGETFRTLLTNVIIEGVWVKLLMDPVLLYFENLIPTFTLFPERSSQNDFQSFCLFTGTNRKKTSVGTNGGKRWNGSVAVSPSLLLLEAVCSRQDPAGVDEDSSTAVEVLPGARLVHVDDGLPRLLRDVADFTPKDAERRAIL